MVGETFNTNNDGMVRKKHLSFNGIYRDFLGKEKVSTIGELFLQRMALLGTYSTTVK
jgi:hypothetical protein